MVSLTDQLEETPVTVTRSDKLEPIGHEEVVGMPLFRLADQLSLRGYCNFVTPADAATIWEHKSGCDCCDGYALFPIGFRRDDQSYRVFAICSATYRVVFEL